MRTLRLFLFALFAIGTFGTGIEFLLLGHTEERWQLVPLVLLGLGIYSLLALVWRPGTLGLFRCLMAWFVTSGFAGVYLQYRANVEFEFEMYPSLASLELVRESLTGAFPALAPAAMLCLGSLGLVSMYRYPEGELE